jgi:hypothetical protein
MNMRFGTWKARCIEQVHSGQWQKKPQNISYIKWEYRRSDGTEVAPNQQVNIHLSMDGGMRIMN